MTKARKVAAADDEGAPVHGLGAVTGVSVTWLVNVFRKDRNTIKKLLAESPILRMERRNSPLFDLAQAAAYLVPPKADLEDYWKRMKPEDLPARLQKDVWDAKLKKQTWDSRAVDLWRTEDVLSVFETGFKHLESVLQSFVVKLDDAASLSPEHRNALAQMVGALESDMHEQLVTMPRSRAPARQEDRAAVDDDDLI